MERFMMIHISAMAAMVLCEPGGLPFRLTETVPVPVQCTYKLQWFWDVLGIGSRFVRLSILSRFVSSSWLVLF